MVSFLNPGLLWGLPLALAPVALHLLSFRRARRVPFGDLALLRSAYLRSLPASRLRQWLLLAARCLILACLLLAFARPVIHAGASSASHPAAAVSTEDSVRLVVLLDASYSMRARARGKTRFELAQAAGETLLRLLKPSDKAAVAAFSDGLEGGGLEWASDPGAAAASLRRWEPGWRTTDYRKAYAAAFAFLKKEAAGRKVILLLSDNAAHGLRGLPAERLADSTPGFDASVLLLGVGWEEKLENAAVYEAAPGADPGTGEPALEVRSALSGEPRKSWELSLWARGERVDVRNISLSPGLNPPVVFKLPSAKSPDRWGRLELRPDALAEDDVYFYSLRVQARPKVLLLYGGSKFLEAGRGGYFLKKLFAEADRSLLPYALDIADLGRWSSLPLADYRAIVLADFRDVPEELIGALDNHVRRDGGLWFLPGERARPEAFRPLERLLPGRLGELRSAAGRSYGVVADSRGIPEADSADGAASRFSWKDFDLQNVAVGRSYDIEPAPSSRVWLRGADGRPLVVAGEAGRGKTILWGCSLDLEWTNLGLKPVFAALVDRGLAHLTASGARREWRTLKVGQAIVRTWEPGEPAPAAVRLRGPQGRRAALSVSGRKAQYPDTPVPGLYFLEGAGPEPEAYAVNLDRSTSESDLTPVARPPWVELKAQSLREDFLRALYGREARTGVLAAALALLVAEVLLGAPRKETRA